MSTQPESGQSYRRKGLEAGGTGRVRKTSNPPLMESPSRRTVESREHIGKLKNAIKASIHSGVDFCGGRNWACSYREANTCLINHGSPHSGGKVVLQ